MNPFLLPSDAELFESLADQTIRYLKALASCRKIPKYSRLNKPQLIEVLS